MYYRTQESQRRSDDLEFRPVKRPRGFLVFRDEHHVRASAARKGQSKYSRHQLQRPPDLTNRLGQANYSLNPEIRYKRIFYEVKISFHLKNHSLNPAIR